MQFIDCSRREIWNNLMPRINCSIYGLESLIPADAKISECKSNESASQTYSKTTDFLREFYSNFSRYNCPVPCTHKSYSVDIQFFNKNTYVENDIKSQFPRQFI